jgi:hypothetical protein
MRCSIGGWLENSAISPLGMPVMPIACTVLGSSPGVRPPRRARAFIIGCGRPIMSAAPRSARNSRWRENQATMIAASAPSTMSSTMVVT